MVEVRAGGELTLPSGLLLLYNLNYEEVNKSCT
jgi:hypothetical protein